MDYQFLCSAMVIYFKEFIIAENAVVWDINSKRMATLILVISRRDSRTAKALFIGSVITRFTLDSGREVCLMGLVFTWVKTNTKEIF